MEIKKKGDMKSVNGTFLTLALFIEHANTKYEPSFTLKDYDFKKGGVVYPSLKKIYLDYADPTGYSFATEVLGGWKHWCKLRDSYDIGPTIREWQDELEVKIRSESIRDLRKAAKEGSKGISAAKYVAEMGWEKKRGRPSKEEVERTKKIHSGITKDLNDDAKRLGMH